MSEFLQQLINGLSLGAIYALIALGYTMVYGVLRFINFAHSDIFMIGAFVGFYAAPKISKLAALPSFTGAVLVMIAAMFLCAVLIISFTFGLGSALAGAGGILYAMNYPSIDPLMGIMPGLKAFVAAVLGGIGNIPGAALGGIIIGVVETFVAGSGASTYRDAIAFAVLILILLFRPPGLL